MAAHEGGWQVAGLGAASAGLMDGTLPPPLLSATSLCLSGSESEASCVTVAEAKSGESSSGVTLAEGKGGADSSLRTGESSLSEGKADSHSEAPGTSAPSAAVVCKARDGGGQRSVEPSRNAESPQSERPESVGDKGILLHGGSASDSESEDAPGLLEALPLQGLSDSEPEDAPGPLEAVCALAAQAVCAPSKAGAREGKVGKECDAATKSSLLREELLPGVGAVYSDSGTATVAATVAGLVTAGGDTDQALVLVPAGSLETSGPKPIDAAELAEPVVLKDVPVAAAVAEKGGPPGATAMPEGYDDSTLDCCLSAAEKWADMLECGAEDILQFTYEDIAGPINQVSLPEPAIVSEAFPEDSIGAPDLEQEQEQEQDFGNEALEVLGRISGIGMGAIGGIGMAGLGVMEMGGMGGMDSRHENELRDAMNSVSGSLRNFKGGSMDWENLSLPEIYDFCSAPCAPALPPRQRCRPLKRKGVAGDSDNGVGECEFDGDYEAFCREMEAEGLALSHAPVPVRERSKRVRKSKPEWAPKFLSQLQEKVPGRRRGGGFGHPLGAASDSGAGAGGGAGVGTGAGTGAAGGAAGLGRSPGSRASPVALGGPGAIAGGGLAPDANPGYTGLQSEASGAGSLLASGADCGGGASGALGGAVLGSVSGAGALGQARDESQVGGVTGQGQGQGKGDGQGPEQGNSTSVPGAPKAHVSSSNNKRGNPYTETGALRRCSHCSTTKTPQWRAGPKGPKTLCNACGVRFKSGRLCAEYRPASSPEFEVQKHSNSHRRIVEMRKLREGGCGTEGEGAGRDSGLHGPSPLSKPHATASGSKKTKKSAPQTLPHAPKPKKATAGHAALAPGEAPVQKVQASAQAPVEGQGAVGLVQLGEGPGQEVRVRSRRLQQKQQMRRQLELEQQQQEQEQEQQEHRQQQRVQQQEGRQGQPKGQPQEDQAQALVHGTAQGQTRAEASAKQPPKAQANTPSQGHAQAQTQSQPLVSPSQPQAQAQAQTRKHAQSQARSQLQPRGQSQPQPQPQSQTVTEVGPQAGPQPLTPHKQQAAAVAAEAENRTAFFPHVHSPVTESSQAPTPSCPVLEAKAPEAPLPVSPSSPASASVSGASGSFPVAVAPKSPVTVSRALSLSPVTVLGALSLSPVTVSEAGVAVPDGALKVHTPVLASGQGRSPLRSQAAGAGSPPPVTSASHKSPASESVVSLALSPALVQPPTAAGAGAGPSSLSPQSQVTPGPGQSQVTTGPGQSQVTPGPGQSQVTTGPGQSQVTPGPGQSQVTTPTQSQVTPGPGQSQVTTPKQSPASIISVRVLVGEGAAEAAQRPPSACCIELGKQFLTEALGRGDALSMDKKGAGSREKEEGGKGKGKENEGAGHGTSRAAMGKVTGAGGGGLPISLVSRGVGGVLFTDSAAKDKGTHVHHGPGPVKVHQGQQGQAPQVTGQQWQSPRKVNQMRASACPSNLPPLSYIAPHKTRPRQEPVQSRQEQKQQGQDTTNSMPDTPTSMGSPAKVPAAEAGREADKAPVVVALAPVAVPPVTVTQAPATVTSLTTVAPAAVRPVVVPAAATGSPSPLCGPKTPVTVTPAQATVTPPPLAGPKTPGAGVGEPTVGAPWEDRGSERRFSMREGVRVQA